MAKKKENPPVEEKKTGEAEKAANTAAENEIPESVTLTRDEFKQVKERIDQLEKEKESDVALLQRLQALSRLAEQLDTDWSKPVIELARQPYSRVIYLGSGPLEAAAREAALKLLELTAGRVTALANTPLGFRHGPKSLLDGDTLVLVLRSAQALPRRYEQDLLDELRGDGVAARVLSVGPAVAGQADDFALAVPDLPDPWLAPLWLGLAQRYALQRSLAQGLSPDNPYPDGTVNRVVQGVTIHH